MSCVGSLQLKLFIIYLFIYYYWQRSCMTRASPRKKISLKQLKQYIHAHTHKIRTFTPAIINLWFCSPTQADLSIFGHFIHYNVNEVEWVSDDCVALAPILLVPSLVVFLSCHPWFLGLWITPSLAHNQIYEIFPFTT